MPESAPAAPLRGCFVTATDTGVGKTVVAAAICAALRADGVRVAASKPVVTGLDEPEAPLMDHELLAACTGQTPGEVTPVAFGPAVSPHLAARQAGTPLDPDALLAHARAQAARTEVLVGEGVGGLLVPLTERWSVRDHAAALGLPLILAARPGLGTINHTLLSLEAARAAGLEVRAVVLTPWPAAPSAMEADNRETLAALGGVPVWTLAALPALTPETLAAGARAAGWPLADWVA